MAGFFYFAFLETTRYRRSKVRYRMHENFSFKLVFYVGEEPLETKLFNEPVVCIFIFRSFRLLWTNPNIHGTIHIIALIIRLSVRNFHVEEPIWARDPLALFWGEIIVSTLLLLVTRSISVFQGHLILTLTGGLI